MTFEPASTLQGVICIFCSTRTPLHTSFSDKKTSLVLAKSKPRLSLVRCQYCGKEAPYPAIEIIPLPVGANYQARG
jgi:hypothetical protein